MESFEALYGKLYDKYTKLKKEKESALEQLNQDQEVKFMNYVDAADEMIKYLKNENERLRGQVVELKSELVSIRSAKDEEHIQHQNLLEEEKEKNKELNEQIVRLKMPREDEPPSPARHDKIGGSPNAGKDSLVEGVVATHTAMKSRKRHRSLHVIERTATPVADVELDQPACCQKKVGILGGDAKDTSSFNCMYQDLIEFIFGMKFSTATQPGEICISAVHQSSGYSFSLTQIRNSHGETELLYRVLSLGTFERVAPEWMKEETLMFSTSMCPVFLDKVSRVTKG